MGNLSPKKWTLPCWILLALWSLIGIGNNIPYSNSRTISQHVASLPDDQPAAVYDVQSSLGFPFSYLEQLINPKTGQTKTSFHLFWLALNIALVALVLIGLVWTVQTWFFRFSVRGFLIATIVVAIVIAVGVKVFSFNSRYLQATYVYSIFFCPLITGAIGLKLRASPHK